MFYIIKINKYYLSEIAMKCFESSGLTVTDILDKMLENGTQDYSHGATEFNFECYLCRFCCDKKSFLHGACFAVNNEKPNLIEVVNAEDIEKCNKIFGSGYSN